MAMLMDDYPEECERIAEQLDWGEHLDKQKTDTNQAPSAAYNKLSEALRQSFPHEAVCSMFCGGRKCKFCCADHWKPDEQAIKGLYSHWVTDNVLAMSRPITENVAKFKIIDQFKAAGINAIINVQLPGEHASCGNGLHNNEFSYKQQDFMDNGVFFYNFGWKDFGVVESMATMLDYVKVMQFAISQGKVAIHCHAGKGRTGVLIGCFLVYHNRMSANEAIYYIRSRRPKSIQTGPQVRCVQQFEKYLAPLRIVYSVNTSFADFNLVQYLMRQKAILHGYQARRLKHLPKPIYVICERLLKLARKQELLHIPSTSDCTSVSEPFDVLNPPLPKHQPHTVKNGIHGSGIPTAEVHKIGTALITTDLSDDVKNKVLSYEQRLNKEDSTWDELRSEDNPQVLSALLWEWLDQLKDPIIRRQDMNLIYNSVDQPQEALKRLEKGAETTIIYLMEFLVKLQPIEQEIECDIVCRLVSALTHLNIVTPQYVSASAEFRTTTSSLHEMKDMEKWNVFRFFYNLLEVTEDLEIEKDKRREQVMKEQQENEGKEERVKEAKEGKHRRKHK